MKFLATFGGPIVMLLLILNQFCHYGTRWVIGSLGMPLSLVSPDGRTYADGTPVSAVSAMLIRSGLEEQLTLGLFLFSAVVMTAAVWFGRNIDKTRRQVSEQQRLTAKRRQSKA